MFTLKRLNSMLFRFTGLRLTRNGPFGDEVFKIDPRAAEIITNVQFRTMTSEISLFNLILATRYIIENNILGDIVECGVWRAGSMMAVAHTLVDQGNSNRRLYLYDTYEGMTGPTEKDRKFNGESAETLLGSFSSLEGKEYAEGVIAYASLTDVQIGMSETKYNLNNIFYIKGDVCETLQEAKHSQIAILRLDTDWYESTLAELEALWPYISSGGVLILDDYDYWNGARLAVDEFFEKFPKKPFMAKLGGGGRLIIKN